MTSIEAESAPSHKAVELYWMAHRILHEYDGASDEDSQQVWFENRQTAGNSALYKGFIAVEVINFSSPINVTNLGAAISDAELSEGVSLPIEDRDNKRELDHLVKHIIYFFRECSPQLLKKPVFKNLVK